MVCIATCYWDSVLCLTENKRNAIEIFLKAASYCQCAITSVLPNIPEEIKYANSTPVFLVSENAADQISYWILYKYVSSLHVR